MAAEALIPPRAQAFLEVARVAHLATADAQGRPTVLPICFQVRAGLLYSLLDAKPKQVPAARLQRVRDLLANPQAAVVAHRWDEDWQRLGWVLLRGSARLEPPGPAQRQALELLRAKYPQYRAMDLEQQPAIVMTVQACRTWGDLS